MVLAKEIWAGHFALCGPDFLLGQTQTCQRFGLKLVTVLRLLCGCGLMNDGKFCLWDPSSHPYLFAFQAVLRLPWLLALCAGFAVGVPPAWLCPLLLNILPDKVRPGLGDRMAQRWFSLAAWVRSLCLGEEESLARWRQTLMCQQIDPDLFYLWT